MLIARKLTARFREMLAFFSGEAYLLVQNANRPEIVGIFSGNVGSFLGRRRCAFRRSPSPENFGHFSRRWGDISRMKDIFRTDLASIRGHLDNLVADVLFSHGFRGSFAQTCPS